MFNNMYYGASKELVEQAREHRKNMTDAEKLLWVRLKNRRDFPDRMRSQHPVFKFILDFYCHQSQLAIEVDGGYHKDRLQRLYDKDRTLVLARLGIRVIRFTNEEVINDIDFVVNKIKECL